MATARIVRGDQVVEVRGITPADAAFIAHAFAARKDPVVAGDGALLDQANPHAPIGFAPIEVFTASQGVSR